jgi:ATP-binding cassette, subfamily B, bacterial
MDCGPTCLRMVAKFYGRSIPLDYLRSKSQYGKNGVSLLGLADAAESIGMRSIGAKLTFQQLMEDAKLPAIIHWDQYHFVVLTPNIKKNELTIADPAKGLLTIDKQQFLQHWISTKEGNQGKGITLLLEPTPAFKEIDYTLEESKSRSKIGWSYLFDYLKQHRRYILQIILGFILVGMLQLFFPYLTRSIVDTGINTRDLNFVQIILVAQLMLLFSQTLVEFIRSRLLLHISTRINIGLLSGFWSKLLKLPMTFFDSKHTGDILQRLQDHQRIESFLTGTVMGTFFSLFNILLFSFVLLSFNVIIFGVFFAGSILYLAWIRIFLRYRRKLDYQRFAIAARENNATMQLVNGMQEIKLNNAENTYRWAWENFKATLFKLNYQSLSLDQYQQIGAFFINQSKNIVITFMVAKLVIDGSLTMGMMLAIQYIIGQLNGPIEQLIGLTQKGQDARMSMERLNDIHALEDEEPINKDFKHSIPEKNDIQLRNVSFTYPGAGNEAVLKNIDLTIPQGRVTAIVGMSGSGKSTLIKLLLRFYETYKGEIFLGDSNFKTISPRFWRGHCGAVMQDSFIFNATIRKNITVKDDLVDESRLLHACRTASILDFIESLPLGFYTKLGAEGNGISGGQKQRITIARAVYKNPNFIFLDEATNSLDANNEKTILENLEKFYEGKTVVVVAHRLSTVKKADKIVVLENGKIAEEGNHEQLTVRKGKYYNLVKNQLELGK